MRDVHYTAEDLEPRRARVAPEAFDEPARTPFWRGLVGRSPADMVAIGAAAFVCLGIAVNALARQSGPHPAPMFQAKAVPAVPVQAQAQVVTPLPQPKPPETTASITPQQPPRVDVQAPPRSRAELVSEIQRELTRRGFYEGTADGRVGPRTAAAIRDYETSVGLRVSGEASEQLLTHLRDLARARGQAPLQAAGQASGAAQPGAQPSRPRAEAAAARAAEPEAPRSITQLIEASATPARPAPVQAAARPADGAMTADQRRILTAERALERLGYGPLSVDGRFGADTREAIQRFERDHRMPVTGQLNERVTRELAAISGLRIE